MAVAVLFFKKIQPRQFLTLFNCNRGDFLVSIQQVRLKSTQNSGLHTQTFLIKQGRVRPKERKLLPADKQAK